jgi:histidinol phosphatase-like PHP family hydrolase
LERPSCDNAKIAELLAIAGDSARPPLTKAFRRASRRAFLWPEEAADLLQKGRSLTELPGIGPYLEKIIGRWINDPPETPKPPEMRKGFLTVIRARAIVSEKPAWLKELKGDLQMHSEWSDGSSSIRDLAAEADRRGYKYIAITDHAKGLKIAGGIDEKQLKQQAREIAAVNNEMNTLEKPLCVLRSIELNLNPRGEGDMDSRALDRLDIVLGCFHSSLRKKEDQTDRYVAALTNPTIQILGHPRGRIYNFRLGLSADWARVFGVAAELDKAVEIDSYPDRQDLSPNLVRLARKAGCRISLGTDSHGPSQLRFIEFGLASAMMAGIKRDRILNFMNREQLLTWVATVREQTSNRIG